MMSIDLQAVNNQRDNILIQYKMNQVQALIIQALTTADNNQLRQQAENTIFRLLSQNPTEFFLTCARVVADQTKKESIRQSAASVMKAVLTKRSQNNEYFWDLVNPHIRPQIKQILLSNLISPNLLVMRAGANTIAQIAAIQIARNEWLEIVNALAQNSMHQQFNIRRASITTLGFICEELKLVRSNIKQSTCEQILGSLLIGLRQTGDIVEISLNALRESISFLQNILQRKVCSDKVFQFILPLLNTDYSSKIYEILYQFGKECYHLLPNYLNQLIQLTTQHIQQRNDNAVLAIQFWQTVGEQYKKRTKDSNQRINSQSKIRNYMQQVNEVLLPQIMGCMLILGKSDFELPDLRQSSVRALTVFVSCCGREVVDKIIEGVKRVIQSPNLGERQASALLFSCLSQYSDRDYTLNYFANGFNHLYSLIEDPQIIVKKNTLSGFLTLSQCFPQVFIENQDIFAIVQHLLKLSVNPDQDIQILSLSIIINLSEVLKDFPSKISSEPDEILKQLIEIFTNNLNMNMHKQSNEKIIIVLMNIIMATEKKSVLVMLIKHLIELYLQYCKSKISDREIVLSQIITLIHTSVLSMSKFSIDSDLRRKIYQLIDLHMSIHGVEQQGINMISAIAISFKRQFLQEHFQKYWNFIMQGLEMIEQKGVFKATLACISDISRNHQNKITNKLTIVFDRLLLNMNHIVDRELKTQILKCFGDILLGLKGYGQVFIQTLIGISNQCFEAVYALSKIQSQRQYSQELKEALIEMYHCVVFAQNQQQRINHKLANHFPIVAQFIVRSCDVSLKPTLQYIKICLYLIFDSALFYFKHKKYSETVDQIIKSRQINNLINIMKGFNDRVDVRDLLNYIEEKLNRR